MIRRAGVEDLVTVFDLEKAASTAGLFHVFGPDLPFPDDDVLARWHIVLEDADVTVLISEQHGEPVGYAAYDDQWLRHFGVHPAWWGSGEAEVLHEAVIEGLRDAGAETAHLWVLVDNHRARAFYARRGWRETGIREFEVFPPYPAKMHLQLTLTATPP